MKNRWLDKNVNISMLAERIKPFFDETDFKTSTEETQEGYVTRAVSKIPNLKLKVSVEIRGCPSDFTVEFSTGAKGGVFSPAMIIGYLTTMFGGGYLISREARKQETLEMLEDDFWRYTRILVADLVGSVVPLEN